MALAKLTRPSAAGAVPRPRLFRRLDHDGPRRVSWVSGPPGAGKTTLVASYIETRKLPCLWYQVDEGDADPASFFYYLRAAAAQAAPRHKRPLPLFTPEYRLGLPTFTRNVFRDLYGRLKVPFLIVFDNWHDLPMESPLHEVLRIALEEVPQGGRAILMSRNEPPLPLARLRASQALDLLTWTDLRLTRDEAVGLGRRVVPGRLPRATIHALHAEADGWAAGLVLLLERLKTVPQTSPATGPRAPQALFDYFAAELFLKLDPGDQDVLLQLAFLPRTTAGMADALTGVPTAGQLLERLHRENYFVARNEEAEPTYQFHPLFREFLLARAYASFPPARRAEIQRAAALLLDAAAQPEPAVALLRAVPDWPSLAALILRHAPVLVGQGRHDTVLEWLDGMPFEVLEHLPWLLYWRGVGRAPIGARESRGDFEQALRRFRAQGDATGILLAWCGAVDTLIHERDSYAPLDQWIALLPALLAEVPVWPSREVEAHVAASMLGALWCRDPSHAEFTTWAERVLALSQEIADPALRLKLTLQWLLYVGRHGNHRSLGQVEEALRALVGTKSASPALRLTAMYYLAENALMSGDLTTARRRVAAGLELARVTGIHIWTQQILGEGIYIALMSGDHATARAQLEQMAEGLTRSRLFDLVYYHYLVGLEALLRDDLVMAGAQQNRVLELSRAMCEPTVEVIALLFAAQVLHGQRQDDAASAHLAQAVHIVSSFPRGWIHFNAFLCAAYMALDRGRDTEGLAALAEAMALGREKGYLHALSWRPAVMARLCAKALEAGIEVEYVRLLIRKWHLTPATPPVDIPHWPWPVRIVALGRFEVRTEDKPIHFEGKAQKKPLVLLKALLAFGGQGVREATLTEALWPEAEGDAAAQALATTLHRLRRLLGHEQALVRQDGQISLDPRCCWVDIWAFQRLLAQMEATAARGPGTDQAHAQLGQWAEQATALYQGPFLNGDDEYPWAVSLAERLRARWLRHLDKLGRHWESLGEWQRALNCYEQGLEADDCAEELCRRLMTLYQRQGRRAQALAAYQRCRTTLAAKLGIAPAPETEALHRALRAG